MKNPKKHGKPHNIKPPAGAGGSASLPSEQWLSESTVFAVPQQAEGSPSASASDTGGPPDPGPCKKNTDKKSGDLFELQIKRENDIHDIVPNPRTWAGATDYKVPPYPGLVDILCDKTSWRPRVKDGLFQIHYYAGVPPKPLSLAQINATTDCNVLKQMLDAVEKLAPTGGLNGVGLDWCPDTFIESHELVHAELLRASAQARFATFKAAVDALSAPCADDWYPLIQFTDAAKKAFQEGVIEDRDDSFAHKPEKPFIDGSKAACQPFIDAINARRTALGCP